MLVRMPEDFMRRGRLCLSIDSTLNLCSSMSTLDLHQKVSYVQLPHVSGILKIKKTVSVPKVWFREELGGVEVRE